MSEERDPYCPDCGGYGTRRVLVQSPVTGDAMEDQEDCDCRPADTGSAVDIVSDLLHQLKHGALSHAALIERVECGLAALRAALAAVRKEEK